MNFFINALSFLLLLDVTNGRILFKEPRKWNRHPGWPGVKIRLTRKGAEHVKNVGVKILNEEIPLLRGFSAEHSFSQPGIEGKVILSEVQVLHYSPPQFTSLNFMPPSYLLLQLQGIDIALTGRFLGLIGLASIQGAVTGDIRQMGVAVQIEFKTAPDGLMRVRVVDCSTTLLYSQFFIDAEGPFSGFVKTFEVQINDIIRRRIPSIFCSSLQKFIEDASPTLFKVSFVSSVERVEILNKHTEAINLNKTEIPLFRNEMKFLKFKFDSDIVDTSNTRQNEMPNASFIGNFLSDALHS